MNTVDISTVPARYTYNDDGFTRLLRDAYIAGDSEIRVMSVSSKHRTGTTPTLAEQISINVADGVDNARIVVYYIPINKANTAILGAAF